MKKLYLHIGTNKTGSSSLQYFLSANREALKQRGICYPVVGLKGHAHHELSNYLKRPNLSYDSVNADWLEQIALEAHDQETVILSSEDFHTHKDAEAFAVLKEHYDVTVVIYMRDPVTYIASWYAQAVQSRSVSSSVRDFSMGYGINYPQLIKNWIGVFGRRKVVLRKFSRSELKGQDIRKDFLSVAKIKMYPEFQMTEDKNYSLSGNLLHFKRLFNCFVTEAEARSISSEFGFFTKLDPTFSGRFRIETDDVEFILHRYHQHIKVMKDRHGLDLSYNEGFVPGNLAPNFETLSTDFENILSSIKQRGGRVSELTMRFMPHLVNVKA